jgi:hypothetical protein
VKKLIFHCSDSSPAPDYASHTGQAVRIIRELTHDENDSGCTMYLIEAMDGWQGSAFDDELTETGGTDE